MLLDVQPMRSAFGYRMAGDAAVAADGGGPLAAPGSTFVGTLGYVFSTAISHDYHCTGGGGYIKVVRNLEDLHAHVE
jgi:hypothetical protein